VDKVRWAIAVNVALIAVAVLLTLFVDRHLSGEIGARRVSFASCASKVERTITRVAIQRRIRKRRIVGAKIQLECGWAKLSTQKLADVIGTASFIVALGLCDFLLWRIRRPKIE
jgi:hypothetical protein